jgi:mRNA-degrading endonuclease RelE of RelBE toxin-antitoxin system
MSKRKDRSADPPPNSPPGARTEAAQPRFELRFTADAAADIQKLDGSVRSQLRKVLEKKLGADPEAYGLPLRHPLTNYWKHEFAQHRVIYRVYRELRIVVVCAVGVRKQGDAADVYKQLEALARTGRVAEQLANVLKQLIPPKK